LRLITPVRATSLSLTVNPNEDWAEGRRQRVEGNPNFSGRKSKLFRKEIQGKPEGNPSICLPVIEPFQ
jgi:hypothetical protein